MRKHKILLVDDENSILKSMKKDFEFQGYEVMTATSAELALEICESQQFNLVVTDLSMPGMHGIKLLAEVKKLNPDIGSIILTGYGDMTSAIEALRLGADDYLLKPCDTEELQLRVSRCIKNREAHQKVKIYENILPVCAYCKSIRDDKGVEHAKGKWMPMEEYIQATSGTDVTHGICPICYEKEKAKF
jgi:YesN/AraC family two-component response regulator